MALPELRISPITATIKASAPGKVVLSGEYAVLAGAPALVLATNRFAHCTLTTTELTPPVWQFASQGFAARSSHTVNKLLTPETIAATDPARLCAWVMQQLGKVSVTELPASLKVHTDTTEMYHDGNKLGLGSSAALTTALAGALWRLAQLNLPQFAEIHAAHKASQNGVGSGLDVATSRAGGVIRFQAGESKPAQFPDDLAYRFIYAGKPASTPELVGRFNLWRAEQANSTESLRNDELTALINASATLANRGISLDNFARYIIALRHLDEAATIGIFSAEHADIAIAAERANVLYKPCGAGGGDLGIALSDSQQNLDRFTTNMKNAYAVIDLEIASNGLTIG